MEFLFGFAIRPCWFLLQPLLLWVWPPLLHWLRFSSHLKSWDWCTREEFTLHYIAYHSVHSVHISSNLLIVNWTQLSCTNQLQTVEGWNCASDVKLTQQTTCLKQGLLVNRSSNINLSMTIDLVKWVHKVKCSDDSEEGILQGWQTSYTWSHLRSDLSHILTSTAPIYQV